MDRCLENIQNASDHISDRVRLLDSKTGTDTYSETRHLNTTLEQMNGRIHQLEGSVQSMESTLNDALPVHIQNVIDTALPAQLEQAALRITHDVQMHQSHVFTWLSNQAYIVQPLGHQPVSGRLGPESSSYSSQYEPISETASISAPKYAGWKAPAPLSPLVADYTQFFLSLGVAFTWTPEADLDKIDRFGHNVRHVERCAWIFTLPRFHTWFHSGTRRSDLILVNGGLGNVTSGRISAMSALVAKLLHMRRPPPPTCVVLYHFCGLHTQPDANGLLTGPQGIMVSLIAQLMLSPTSNGDISLAAAALHQCLQAVAGGDLDGLCRLFHDLILSHMSPHTTAYCILDNVQQFETDRGRWADELCRIVLALQELVNALNLAVKGSTPVLKVLLTAGIRSICINQHLRTEDQIWVRTNCILPRAGWQQYVDWDAMSL